MCVWRLYAAVPLALHSRFDKCRGRESERELCAGLDIVVVSYYLMPSVQVTKWEQFCSYFPLLLILFHVIFDLNVKCCWPCSGFIKLYSQIRSLSCNFSTLLDGFAVFLCMFDFCVDYHSSNDFLVSLLCPWLEMEALPTHPWLPYNFICHIVLNGAVNWVWWPRLAITGVDVTSRLVPAGFLSCSFTSFRHSFLHWDSLPCAGSVRRLLLCVV